MDMNPAVKINAPSFNSAPKGKLQWALHFASLGIPVHRLVHTNPDGSCSCGSKPDAEGKLYIPGTKDKCSPGKHPLPGISWKNDRTTDQTKIRAWFRNDPAMNYGISGGNGFTIMDLDVKNGKNGIRSMADMLDVSAVHLPQQTFTVKTPTGGLHQIYKDTQDRGNREGVKHPDSGIDCKCLNGYVVGPGSTIYVKDEFEEWIETPYSVVNDIPMTDIPSAITKWLRAATERDPYARKSLFPDEEDAEPQIEACRRILKQRKPAVAFNGGNQHTLVTALQCRDHNISEEQCLSLLFEEGGWNERCEPPWDYEELKGIVKNAYSYAKRAQGNVIDMFRHDPDDADAMPPANNNEVEAEVTAVVKQGIAKGYVDNDVIEGNKKYVPQIIPGWLTATGFTLMVGGKRVGKTTLAVDLVGRIINDEDFYGRTILKGWSVGYVAAEDSPGIIARLAANGVHNGGKFVKDGQRQRLATFKQRIDLRVWAEVKAIADETMRLLGKRKDILMVIDTYGKCLPVDQSDETATKQASANILRLAEYVKGAVLVLAQPSRNGTRAISGSGVLENDAEGLIWLEHNDMTRGEGKSNKLSVLAIATNMKNCESDSKLEFQVLSTVTDKTVRDQEGNLVTAGYASVLRGWNAKGKELDSVAFKQYQHPKGERFQKVQGMAGAEGQRLEGEERELFEDNVRAELLIRDICTAAKEAGEEPSMFRGLDQKKLLAPYGNGLTSYKGVEMLAPRSIRDHMQSGRILRHTALFDGVTYRLLRKDGKAAGRRGPPSPILYVEKVRLGSSDDDGGDFTKDHS